MSVARHGPSEPQLHRLIAEVASASAPAGPKRAALASAIVGAVAGDSDRPDIANAQGRQ